MGKYICVHSHFYQPPRENPWLDKVQQQESALPYHDWNERISNECYRENGRSRIINEANYVTGFSNNYSRMSFNIGPTLLSWLEHYDQRTYDYILKGDMLSVDRFNGHGSAIAQCYNHVIMPLANSRDKETQVIWGIKDFEKRFHRNPEAMWLPETAVDIESLEVLSKHGMKYVILAPRQAKAFKKLNTTEWINVQNENINTRIAYLVKLPSGREISAFFYDGAISKAVAFDGLLHNGDYFANRMMSGFSDMEDNDQLVHIATDGESYGHHHKYGDMALAYAFKKIEENEDIHLCNYGLFLELQPPEHEVQIVENSSWSCAHGIERWRSNCGCNSGGRPSWNQKWRAPLRSALDKLRDTINIKFEETVAALGIDPWDARNEYIHVVFNRNEITNREFLEKWIPQITDEQQQIKFIKCYEMQRQLLLMYTSCAWFFDESSGIETVQVLQYALRAVELAEDIWGPIFLNNFIEDITEIPSNLPEYVNGNGIYEKILKQCQMGFLKIAVHYAVTSLFKEPNTLSCLYSFDVKKGEMEKIKLGSNKVVCGHAEFRSRITYSKKRIMFTAVHLGENIISAGVSILENEKEYHDYKSSLLEKITEADFTNIMREIDKTFGKNIFTLKDMIAEDRSFLIKDILSEKMEVIESQYQQIYNDNFTLVSFLNSLSIDMPNQLKISFEHVVNEKIIQIFKNKIEHMDVNQLKQYNEEVIKGHLHIKELDMRRYFQQRLVDFAESIKRGHYNQQILTNFMFVVVFAKSLIPDLPLSEVQYLIFEWRSGFEQIPLEYEEISQSIFDVLKIKFTTP